MIKRPNNWDEVREFTDRPKLPVSAYVCRVKQAAVKATDYGEQLCILFDIADGEYAGYYQEEFDANTQQDKKWKGVLRQFNPKDDGSEKDEWTKRSFKVLTAAFEGSNRCYVWNWIEYSLVGIEIGILFRNEEWDYNGRTGWSVRPFRALSVDRVADGDYTLPADKPLKNKQTETADAFPSPQTGTAETFETLEDDGQFPF